MQRTQLPSIYAFLVYSLYIFSLLIYVNVTNCFILRNKRGFRPQYSFSRYQQDTQKQNVVYLESVVSSCETTNRNETQRQAVHPLYKPPIIIGSYQRTQGYGKPELLPIRVAVDEELRELLELKAKSKTARLFISICGVGDPPSFTGIDRLSLDTLKGAISDAIPSLKRFKVPFTVKLEYRNDENGLTTEEVLHTNEDVSSKLQKYVSDKLKGDSRFTRALRDKDSPSSHISRSTADTTKEKQNLIEESFFSPHLQTDPHVSSSTRLIVSLHPTYWSNQTHNLMNTIKHYQQLNAVSSYTVLSFFKFAKIFHPEELARKCEFVWKPLRVLGRVYIAKEGVNGQVAVPTDALELFNQTLSILFEFGNEIDLNFDTELPYHQYWNGGNSDKTKPPYLPPFQHLHVRHRPQVVADGFMSDALNLTNYGELLSPNEWDKRCEYSNAMIIDCRNKYESTIGSFSHSIALNTTTFKEAFGDEGALDTLLAPVNATTPLLLYCTGGIRCVKAGAYIIQKLKFKDVSILKGGITAYKNYIQQCSAATVGFTNTSLITDHRRELDKPIKSRYKGSNYVFDNRFSERVTNDIISFCMQCGNQSDRYTNCLNQVCHVRFLQCLACAAKYNGCCSVACAHDIDSPPFNGGGTPSAPSRETATASVIAEDVLIEDLLNSATGRPCRMDTIETMALRDSSVSVQEDLLYRLRAHTMQAYPGAHQMVSSELQGKVLSMLSKLVQPKYILDIGTFTGISALSLAEGLHCHPSSKVYTIEKDGAAAAIARSFIEQSEYKDKIEVIVEPAVQYLQNLHHQPQNSSQLPTQFDLIFLDADKRLYMEYYDLIFNQHRSLLSINGVFLADNTLWNNMKRRRISPLNTESHNRRMEAIQSAMKSFNQRIFEDVRLHQMILPIRDGLSVVQFKKQ